MCGADDKALRAHFDGAASAAGGALRSAAVSRKKEKGPDGQPLSKGFGFVECSSEATAKAVLKQLQVRPARAQGLGFRTSWSAHPRPPPRPCSSRCRCSGFRLQTAVM